TNRSYWTRKIHSLCVVDRNVDEALRLLDHLRLRGYHPDSLNLSSIIHALCDSNRFSEAHYRFVLSIASGYAPDERTCNVLIARLLDSRTPHSTLHVVHRLVVGKPEFVPSLVNYNRLIDQLCSFSRPTEAHRLFFDMKSRGHRPNTVSYTTLINGYCKIGEVDIAQKLLDEMSECEVRPNSLTYSILIRGVLRKRNVEHGRELMGKLWQTMVDEDDPSVNNAAFANLIDSLCHEGLFQEVFKIAEDAPQEKSVYEEFAYGQMIDSLCKAGMHNGAARIVYIMRKRGFTPSLVSYNSIVHGLSKAGGCMRAYQLLEEGIEFEYKPRVYLQGFNRRQVKQWKFLKAWTSDVVANSTTYAIIIDGLCESDRIDEAKRFWDDVIWPSKVHDNFVYAAILKGLCRSGKLNEACDFLYELVDCGVTPNIVNYNILIDSACKLGLKREAYQIVGEMRKNRLAPDAVTWRILDKLHGNVRKEVCAEDSTLQSKEGLQELDRLEILHE
ncbi:hypothetical protein F0562_025309, partial [Nyssa sinensis]